MKLTVVIPAFNEEVDLPRTLESLRFADEVLVIDSGSTDKTPAIAQSFGARVIHHPFKNFASQRNFATGKAKNDWILSLEADVVVPQKLAEEIQSLSNTPAAYKIGRINLIWGQPILHSDWGPRDDNHVRLYHRSLGQWQGDVHEQFVSQAPPRQLKNHLLHYNYRTVSEFINKINFYSDLEAKRRFNLGQRFSYPRFFLEPLRDFGKRYFYKLGFLDSWHGLFLSLLQALYYVSVNIKLKYLS